jgi:hypothetical protein
MEASKLRKREAENRNEMNVTSGNAHKNQNHFIHSELVACEDLFIGDQGSHYNVFTAFNYLSQLYSTQSRGNLDYYIM